MVEREYDYIRGNTKEEVEENPRSRSAKLRVIERI